MKAVVQRVSSARVTVEGEETGKIGPGLLVYLGIGKGDAETQLDWLLAKILGLRIFGGETPEKADKMDRSVLGISGSLLVVSQFTLYGDVTKGNRPGFDGAMPPAEAERLYELFVARARKQLTVATGRFRSDMLVESTNEGPVTILLETP